MNIEDGIRNEDLRCSLAASRHLREADAERAAARIAGLEAENYTLRAEVERLRVKVAILERDIDVGAGNAELLEVEVERLRSRAERAERERDAVCRYASGFLTGKPELILKNALTFAAYIPAAAPVAPAIDPANPPLRLDLQRRRMTRCQSDDDGYCDWEHCPQELDGEEATGRHCPLDLEGSEDADG